MRDANTQIYRFVIQEPPPRAAAAPEAEPFAAPFVDGLIGPELQPEGDPTPTPTPVRKTVQSHGTPTPGRFATPRRPLPPAKRAARPRGDATLVVAGLLIGLGVGGSIDGSAFQQVVLFHAGGTADALVGVKTNPAWDGVLHAFTWLATLVGLGLLWRSIRRPGVVLRTSTFVGSLLLGWGFFNGVEGALDHHLLQLNNAHPGTAQLLWDGGLITSGVVLMMAGALCVGLGRR